MIRRLGAECALTVERVAELTPGNAGPLSVEGAHGDNANRDEVGREVTKDEAEQDDVGRLRGVHVSQNNTSALFRMISAGIHVYVVQDIPACPVMRARFLCYRPSRSNRQHHPDARRPWRSVR